MRGSDPTRRKDRVIRAPGVSDGEGRQVFNLEVAGSIPVGSTVGAWSNWIGHRISNPVGDGSSPSASVAVLERARGLAPTK